MLVTRMETQPQNHKALQTIKSFHWELQELNEQDPISKAIVTNFGKI